MTKQKTTARKTKSATVNRLLRCAKGATLAEIEQATAWQPHSCRAFLSGVRKQGIALVKEERANGETAYKVSGKAEPCHA